MGKHDKPQTQDPKPQGPPDDGDRQVPPGVLQPGGGQHKKDPGKK